MDGLGGYVAGTSTKAVPTPKPAKAVSKVGVSSSKKSKTPIPTPVKPIEKPMAMIPDTALILNAREPLNKGEAEDENMKVLKLLNDIKKLQKKWKAKL
jgi:hypothetical protein